MKTYTNCPICGEEMKPFYSNVTPEPLCLFRCPTPLNIPDEFKHKNLSIFVGDMIKSHFELEVKNGKSVFEQGKIYPFSVCSYQDETNIYTYNNKMIPIFIVAVPYIEIPWQDKDKFLKKLKTYTVFS